MSKYTDEKAQQDYADSMKEGGEAVSSDGLIDFEADNYDELCEKFIDAHKDEWDKFVFEQYADRPVFEPEYDTKEEQERDRRG